MDMKRLELTLKWNSSTDRQPSERVIEFLFVLEQWLLLGRQGWRKQRENFGTNIFLNVFLLKITVKIGKKRKF